MYHDDEKGREKRSSDSDAMMGHERTEREAMQPMAVEM